MLCAVRRSFCAIPQSAKCAHKKKVRIKAMTKYNELMEQALEMLKSDDDLFCEMVEELDSWNGFADGYRCFPMWEIDEFFCDCKVSDFLDKLVNSFRHTDEFFFDSIYGIDSTNDRTDLYKSNTDEGEVLDNVIKYKNHLYFSNSDFESLLDEIEEAREEA